MDSLFFSLSKLIWYAIKPGNLIVIAIIVAFCFLYKGRVVWAKRLLAAITVLLLLILLLPIGPLLLYSLESRFDANPPLPEHVDGIIVLGGAIDPVGSYQWQQVEIGGSAERLYALSVLAQQYPQAKLVYTSGSGSLMNQRYKDADVAKLFYQTLGLNQANMVFERESRNTYENAVNSKNIIKPTAGEVWILVTSASHMPRSIGIFCHINWPVIPYPVDHRTLPHSLYAISLDFMANLGQIELALREWIGLITYYFTDKSAAIYPDQC